MCAIFDPVEYPVPPLDNLPVFLSGRPSFNLHRSLAILPSSYFLRLVCIGHASNLLPFENKLPSPFFFPSCPVILDYCALYLLLHWSIDLYTSQYLILYIYYHRFTWNQVSLLYGTLLFPFVLPDSLSITLFTVISCMYHSAEYSSLLFHIFSLSHLRISKLCLCFVHLFAPPSLHVILMIFMFSHNFQVFLVLRFIHSSISFTLSHYKRFSLTFLFPYCL